MDRTDDREPPRRPQDAEAGFDAADAMLLLEATRKLAKAMEQLHALASLQDRRSSQTGAPKKAALTLVVSRR